MSNIPEDMFKRPKPMVQQIKLPNIPSQPHIHTRPTGPNMPLVPNLQTFQNKLSNEQHQQINQISPVPRSTPVHKPAVLTAPQTIHHNTTYLNSHAPIQLPERIPKQKLQTNTQPSRPNLPLPHTLRPNQATIPPIIQPSQTSPSTETKDIQTDNQNTVLSFSHHRPSQPNIPNIPQANGIAQSIASRLNQQNHFVRPQVQTSSNQNGFLTSYSVKGSTGIQVPPGATKLIVNAVAGGGAGAPNTETSGGGGGGAGAGANGLVIPLNSLNHGTINVEVGIGGGATGTNGLDGTSTVITGNASNSNFSLTLGGGKGGSGNIGGISGNVQFFSKTILASAINGGDCNYKNCFSSGGAGGAGTAPGTKGTDGGCSLFHGGAGNSTTGSGGGGASCFANGGSGDGQLGSGGEGGHLGGDGFASLEFYM